MPFQGIEKIHSTTDQDTEGITVYLMHNSGYEDYKKIVSLKLIESLLKDKEPKQIKQKLEWIHKQSKKRIGMLFVIGFIGCINTWITWKGIFKVLARIQYDSVNKAVQRGDQEQKTIKMNNSKYPKQLEFNPKS